MAHESIAFIEALDLGQVDLLGFSIGSFVAQQIALTRPAIVRRVVLASAAPQGAAGMHGWAAAVIGAIGGPQTSPEQYLDIFFARSPASRQAGQLCTDVHRDDERVIRAEDARAGEGPAGGVPAGPWCACWRLGGQSAVTSAAATRAADSSMMALRSA